MTHHHHLQEKLNRIEDCIDRLNNGDATYELAGIALYAAQLIDEALAMKQERRETHRPSKGHAEQGGIT